MRGCSLCGTVTKILYAGKMDDLLWKDKQVERMDSSSVFHGNIINKWNIIFKGGYKNNPQTTEAAVCEHKVNQLVKYFG